MGTIAQKLAKLLATKADIKAAIAEKGQVPGDVFGEYGDKIRAIQTGVDTSDATATAADIAGGKTAYAKGQKVTGIIPVKTHGYALSNDGQVTYQQPSGQPVSRIGLFAEISEDIILRKGDTPSQSRFWINTDPSNFGDATASDVAQGKKFTSETGVKVPGTLQQASMLGGRPFSPRESIDDGVLYIGYEFGHMTTKILKAGTPNIKVYGYASSFGNATAADVASGKTFTSAEGLNVTGTGKIAEKVLSITIRNTSSATVTLYINSQAYQLTRTAKTYDIYTDGGPVMAVLIIRGSYSNQTANGLTERLGFYDATNNISGTVFTPVNNQPSYSIYIS